MAFPIAEEHLALATREVAEAKNQCALACLISEGTASTNTTKTTAANFKAQVLAERKAMVKAKANPTIVLCSPDFFATMLEFAGEKYIPTSNEMLLRRCRRPGRQLHGLYLDRSQRLRVVC